MATTIAGSKRSYQEMEEATLTARTPLQSQLRSAPSPKISGSVPSRAVQDTNARDPVTAPRRGPFEPLASIVLVGVRGVGKSTLGILAATAYSRRLVDSERAFVEATGETASAYRKANGSAEYRARHNEVLQATLNDNASGAVIVCSFLDLEGRGGEILGAYSQAHPVFHITRDVEGIKSVLRVWTIERINDLLSTSAPLLRLCSNYEFFNLTQRSSSKEELDSNSPNRDEQASDNFLTLKRVERDFLRLLRNAVGDHERGQAHHSAYPFSSVDIEQRKFTYAVTISTSQILRYGDMNLDEAQIGADSVELLINNDFTSKRQYFQIISNAFAIIRRNTTLPIMLTLDTKPDFTRDAFRFQTLEFLLRLGAELVCIPMDFTDCQLDHLLELKGHSKMIGLSELNKRPDQGWDDQSTVEMYTRAAQIGCDIVKVTMPAATVEDCSAVQSFHSRVKALDMKIPLIAYNTGSKGRTSKCFNQMLTSVQPHDISYNGDKRDTTDVSATDISQALFASFVFESMRFFIFGGDVSYSLSPAMHNAAYKACGMRYTYEAVSADGIEKLAALVKTHDFGGTAVVQPYKTMALVLMDAMSRHAEAIGAVNTIVPIREMGANGNLPSEVEILSRRSQQGPVLALYGFNTDWIGIRACIRKGLSPANTIRTHSTALVCGAGGMASSAIYSLVSLGVRNIVVCNRTPSRANALADRYNNLIEKQQLSELRAGNATETHVRNLTSLTSDWPSDTRPPTIIVNCIPRLTAEDAPVDFGLQDTWLRSPTGGVVVEVAYRQPTSKVEQQIKARAEAGWIFMDGYDVLPEQAFSQFELFTGRRAPRKLMRDVIKRHLQSRDD